MWGSHRRELPSTDGDQAAVEAKDFDLEPLESYSGPSGLWRCRHLACGRDVEIRLSNLRRGLRACPYCSPSPGGRRRWPADEAEAIMRAADLKPLEPYAGRRDMAWRCRCNGCERVTSPSLGGILAGQGGCRHCADVRSAAGRRTDPDIAVAAMRAAGLEPLELYATSVTAWRCRCTTCGNEVSPILMKIRYWWRMQVLCHPRHRSGRTVEGLRDHPSRVASRQDRHRCLHRLHLSPHPTRTPGLAAASGP